MHYYEHNVGDYRKDTAHLSLLEHGVYRQLLDSYYLDEHPLTLDHAKLMRSHSVRNADEMRALENVLADFFERTEEGYVHKRCEAVISAYKAKSASARKSAEARWSKERGSEDANAMRTHTDGNANHKPLTTNHKPVKDKQTRVPRFDAQAHLEALGVDSQVARDWITHRKAKKAAPTETAIEGIDIEAKKAGISLQAALTVSCQRGWQGFNAEWMKGSQGPPRGQSWSEKNEEVIAQLTGRNRYEPDDRTIDV
jgi:uncharacterized protein YdaU (DUF1376 family)